MNVLRVNDVNGHADGGIARFVKGTGAPLRDFGWASEEIWREDLTMPMGGNPWVRRIGSPLLARQLTRRRSADVIEVHEPLGAWFVRRPTQISAAVVVMSHGLEDRHWHASLARGQEIGRPRSLKSRIAVPATLVAQANFALRGADAVMVLSEVDRAWATDKLGVSAERVVRISNGASKEFFEVVPSTADRPFTVAFVGSWLDRKGKRELIEAWSLLGMTRGARLVLVGVGVPRERVLREFPASIQPSVVVHEVLAPAEVATVLSTVDVFVLPSWFEGQPLSLLEALASAVPVVATSIGGVVEVLRPKHPHKDGGLLIPPTDAAALAGAIALLRDNDELRRTLAAAARRRAEMFTWQRTSQELSTIYARARENRRARHR